MTNVAAGATGTVYATCPSGKKVLGGGAQGGSQPFAFRYVGTADDNHYFATAKNLGTQADTLHVWAVCANVG
jgi:hypothetical protein